MAAVTQLTTNFLGGVSRQTDDKKLDNQVVDITNGSPDPTYGLVKRGAASYLYDLNKTDNTPFTGDELDDAFWFYAETKTEVTADNADDYPSQNVGDIFLQPWLCCIKNGQVNVWNSVTGAPASVTNNGAGYLTRPNGEFYDGNDFHSRTILDTVIICNRHIKTEMVDRNATFTAGLVGTVRLNTVLGDTDYTVIINGTSYTYKSATETSAEAILNGIEAALPSSVNHSKYKTSVEIWSNTPFTLEVKDGRNNVLMNSYQDEVLNQSLLANPSKPNRLVKVTNSSGPADDYYLIFRNGRWEEAPGPTVDVEIDADTMPHALIYADGAWTFGPIDYIDRLVGDEITNPTPSFIGNTINASFFYNGRLGFLSTSNVIMSQAKDVYNFFALSQLAVTDADPIDINANSTRPTELYEVVTQSQGILLFGTRQQFWLSAPETGVLTPSRAVIQAICSYESDIKISPLDLGTSISFISKTPDYSKLMLMQGQGSTVDPVVVEISKVVATWLPNDINRMAVSPQNSAVVLTGNEDKNIYIYRFYNDGREDKMQAWTKWEMLGEVQALSILNDIVFSVTKNGDRYTTTWVSLNPLKRTGPQFSDDEFKPGGPQLDFLSKPSSVVFANKKTKFYTKFPLLEDKKPRMILTLPVTGGFAASTQLDYIRSLQPLPRSTDDDPGYWVECEQGTDDNGSYFSVSGDFTGYPNGIQLGYAYDYEVILPKFYYKNPSREGSADYTASLIINRIKFAVGLTGAVTFKIKAMGSDEWVDIQHVTDANYYEADTDPIQPEQIFTVPVNQRNKYFQLKVTSDLPFPVSLISMMWEGQYTPRFYQRV